MKFISIGKYLAKNIKDKEEIVVPFYRSWKISYQS